MSTTSSAATPTPLVMQIIVDPSSEALTWPRGPLMAQASHASIAAIQTSLSSRATQEYIAPLNLASMHKVVLQTPPKEDKAKMSLRELSDKLTAARREYEDKLKQSEENEAEGEAEEEFPKHYLWVELPEGVPTCLAIAPNRKPAALKKILRPCTLLKD